MNWIPSLIVLVLVVGCGGPPDGPFETSTKAVSW